MVSVLQKSGIVTANRAHPLARGMLHWWLPLPGQQFGRRIPDLWGSNPMLLGTGTAKPTLRGPSGGPRGFHSLLTDGTADFAQTQNTVALSNVTQLTVAWWGYDDSAADDDDLFWESSANFNSNAGGILSDPHESTYSAYVMAIRNSAASGLCGVSFTRPSAAAWHHYVAVMDLSQWSTSTAVFTVYVDGAAVTLTDRNFSVGTVPTSFGNYTWYFMSRGGTGLWLDGRITDVQIRRGLMNARAVRQLYDESRFGYPNMLLRGPRLPVGGVAAPPAGGALLTRLQAEGLFVGSAL